jgi:TadE-like protein
VSGPRRADRRAGARGQSLVEFSVSVPVFVMLLFGMLEFGFAFNHNLTLEYATREGARTGAALANGTVKIPCASVDNEIIASVQRVLTSPGTPIDISRISSVRIYRAKTTDNSGDPDPTAINTWIPGSDGTIVDGVTLIFRKTTVNWSACSRDNGSTPDSIGISLTYSYRLISPLGVFLGMTGANPAFQMSDQTVMALNPS